jgi:hypothetical protein
VFSPVYRSKKYIRRHEHPVSAIFCYLAWLVRPRVLRMPTFQREDMWSLQTNSATADQIDFFQLRAKMSALFGGRTTGLVGRPAPLAPTFTCKSFERVVLLLHYSCHLLFPRNIYMGILNNTLTSVDPMRLLCVPLPGTNILTYLLLSFQLFFCFGLLLPSVFLWFVDDTHFFFEN